MFTVADAIGIVLIMVFVGILFTWALCANAKRSGRELDEAWQRHLQERGQANDDHRK